MGKFVVYEEGVGKRRAIIIIPRPWALQQEMKLMYSYNLI